MCKYDVRALDEALLESLGTVNNLIDKKQQKMQKMQKISSEMHF